MTPSELVNRFIQAIEARDIDRAVEMLSDDVRYENMPIDPIVGRDAVRATLEMFLRPATDVEWPVVRELTDGAVVINERLDRFRIGSSWLELPVVGIFEVDGEHITLWRDYFDMASYQTQLAALTGS